MSAERGYIKLYRDLLGSPLWQSYTMSRVFIWCLLKA